MRGINHDEDFGWSAAPRFGGGGGGGSTTTNTIQKSDPWSVQQPFLYSGMNAAANLYNNPNNWPQYFPNSTYSPINQSQENALNYMFNTGMQGGTTSLQGAQNATNGVLSGNYTGQTGNTFNAATPALNELVKGAAQYGTTAPFEQSESMLANEMSPGYLNPWNSPSFGTVVNNTIASVLPSIQSSYIGGNRLGGGLAASAASQGLANAVGGLAQNQYNTNQQIQQNAAQQAAQNYGLGLNTTLNAQDLASNNYLTQQGNQIKAMALAPGIDQQAMSDANAAYNAASGYQQNQQQALNAAVQAWNYNQQLPFNMNSFYNNAVAGNLGSSSTGSVTQPYYSNTGANALSGALGGAGLGSALFSAFPATLGSLGLTAGGASGIGAGLGALLAFSDERLKTDIHKIGKSDSGLPLYTYRYKWDEPTTVRMGVMAQEVAKKKPEAVIHTPFGMAVNYTEALKDAA